MGLQQKLQSISSVIHLARIELSGAKQTSSLKHTMILLPLAESRCVA